jgi:hypothetical protein
MTASEDMTEPPAHDPIDWEEEENRIAPRQPRLPDERLRHLRSCWSDRAATPRWIMDLL